MARHVLECLCPCVFKRGSSPPNVEIPLLKKVSKLEFPMRVYSPHIQSSRERYVVPELILQEEANKRRSTASCKMEQHEQSKQMQTIPVCLTSSVRSRILQEKEQSNSKDDDKSFKSFKDDCSLHKSSSLMKRSLKLLRFPHSNKSGVEEKFYSVSDGIQIATCNDPAYSELMKRMYDWTQELEVVALALKQSDVIDLERIRKIALLEIHTKVEEFDNFTEHHNLIYKNTELSMEVELKDFPKIYEEKIYSTLCRFTINCPILAFFTLFNSSECQARLNNLTDFAIASKEPFVILKTEQVSNQLVGRRDLQLLKFSELAAEEVYGIEKKYIYEIDRDLKGYWSNSKQIFKRITRVTRDEGLLEVEIYTEMTMNFKLEVDQKSYFSHCHNRFAEYLLRKLHKKIK